MKVLKINILCIFVFILFVMPPISGAFANDETVGYSVRAIIPENQIDKRQTYFDLLMEPGDEQVIEVEIFNSTNEDTEINVHITNPMTNRNGLIDYTNTEAVIDESLTYPITDIATVENESVFVPAGESRIVPIQLEMPDEEFDGVILGGIYFEKPLDEEELENIQISNKYAYVIGLKLTETESIVKPDLHLKSVKPDLVNYHTSIIANIQNSEPVIIDNLHIHAKVYNSKNKEMKNVSVEDYRMAPNSNMDFVIDWNNRKLEPDTYTLALYASIGSQNWEWEESFEIKSEQARQINEEAVEIKKDYTGMIIAGLLVIIFLLIFVIIKLSRKNKHV